MEDFNRYLQSLASLDIDYQTDSDFQNVENELHEIAQTYVEEPLEIRQILAAGRRPLEPFVYDLTIYYPISRHGEFPPSPVTYRSPNPITPADLINSINEVYRTPLSQATIDAYIKMNPSYADLNEPILRIPILGGPKLRDVVNDYPTSLQPYRDGYLLKLTQQ